ncbi:hypothetical protein EDD15DRAFT_2234106, partial [Pisolithus albus]
SHPHVPLQTLMQALVSYRTLFVDRCTSCQRVLSIEGHIPPAGRIWVPKDSTPRNSHSNHDHAGANNCTSGIGFVSGKDAADHHSIDHWEPRHVTCLYS